MLKVIAGPKAELHGALGGEGSSAVFAQQACENAPAGFCVALWAFGLQGYES